MNRRAAQPSRLALALRRTAAACAFALAACAAGGDEVSQPPAEPTPLERRHRMLLGVERVIHHTLQDARRDARRVSDGFQASADSAPRAFRLNSSDPTLAIYGDEEQRLRRAAIEQAQAVAEAKLALLLEQHESALWAAARRSGLAEQGGDLGTRTGYQELDDKVEAGALQLQRAIDVEAIRQAATLMTYDDVSLDREVRHEVAGAGVLGLFKSPPTVGLFAPGQEAQAVVVTFVRDALPPEVPLSFVQAERSRVERGSMLLSSTPWRLESGIVDRPGVVPVRSAIDARKALATEIRVPSIDVRSPSFRDLHNHVVAREFRTALRRDDTGEILATMGWQVRWNVDFRGMMRVLTDVDDRVLADDSVLPSMLAAAAPRQ